VDSPPLPPEPVSPLPLPEPLLPEPSSMVTLTSVPEVGVSADLNPKNQTARAINNTATNAATKAPALLVRVTITGLSAICLFVIVNPFGRFTPFQRDSLKYPARRGDKLSVIGRTFIAVPPTGIEAERSRGPSTAPTSRGLWDRAGDGR
jgi:hypothetical protein